MTKPGDVVDGVPLGPLQRGTHRRGVLAVGDQLPHPGRRGGAAAVEQGDVGAVAQQVLDQPPSDEARAAQDERAHGSSRFRVTGPTLTQPADADRVPVGQTPATVHGRSRGGGCRSGHRRASSTIPRGTP